MVIGLPPDGLTPPWEKDFAAYTPAGVILFRRDFRDLDDLRRLTARLRELARPRRIFISMDEEGGFVSQLDGHLLASPNAALLARGALDADIEWIARVTGERLRALGLDWDFAPVADVHSEPRNPVIGPRAFGTSPADVSRRVGAWLRGFKAAGLAGCLKHFPGHGDTVLDSHHALPRCEAPREVLESREFAPFREQLTHAASVMTAHVVYPALDAERPGTYSPTVVRGLLRDQLGYQGIAITDALEMKGAAEGREVAERARLALEAGCDLLLFAFHDDAIRRARLLLADDLVEGRLDRASFDEARPRLATFDREHPEPTANELARPLESLTPADWVPRLTAIAERGLVVRGSLSGARGPVRVTEPEYPRGGSLASGMTAHGLELTDDPARAAVEVVVVMTRVAVPAEQVERLRATARAKPLALVSLQSDVVLDEVPGAAVRIAASDATELTRGAVARRVAETLRAGA